MLIYDPLAPLESGYLPALIRQANSVPTAMASLPSSPAAAAGNAHFHRLPTKGRAVCQQKINLCIVHFTSSERTKCVSAAWNKMQRDPGLKDAAWRRSKEFGLQMLFGASAVH